MSLCPYVPMSLCPYVPMTLRLRAIDEELEGIERSAVDEDFVVQVVAGGPPGGAGEAHQIAALHPIAGLHRKSREVRVARRDTEAVADDHHVAVRARGFGRFDGAGGGGEHRLAVVGRDVEAGVVATFAPERIATVAEFVRHPPARGAHVGGCA